MKIKRILIIRLSSLGDVLLASPLIRILRKDYPNARIDFVVREEYADLVRYNPNLSNILRYDAYSGFPGLRKLRREIKRGRYQVVIDIHRNLRSFYLRFGFSLNPFVYNVVLRIKKFQMIRFLLVKFKINLYRKIYGRIIPVWEKYIRTAAPLDVMIDEEGIDLFLPNEAESAAERFYDRMEGENWNVVMAPGSKHFTKRWPPEYFASLIKEIFDSLGYRTILVGGPQDAEICEQILNILPEGISVSTAGNYTVLETAAIMKHSKLVVANDSGLMHVASAFPVSLIAIFGSTVQELGFFPHSPLATVLENQGLYCRPCSHIGRSACPEQHFRCMKEITPDTVFARVERILKK